MSRRSRRGKATAGGGWLGRAAVALVALCLLVPAVGYVALRRYLHSDSFRKFLSAEASEAAEVRGEFSTFRWDGLAVETDSFVADGGGAITGLRADGLHTEIGLGGVRRGVWEIKGSTLQRLEVTVDATRTPKAVEEGVKDRPAPPKPPRSKWLPSEAELQGLHVKSAGFEVKVPEGVIRASGMDVQVEQVPGNRSYTADIRGGNLRLPFARVPVLVPERLRLRYQDDHVFVTQADFKAFANGRIEATGEYDLKNRRSMVDGGVSGLECGEVFGEDWAKRLTGQVMSSFTLDQGGGAPSAHGTLTLLNGVVTALPVLDTLAAYADTRRFRVLSLNEAHTDWRWVNGELKLTGLVLSSDGLVRLEGALDVRGRELDGRFRLGLIPGTMARIPGAETEVFLPGERGLLWTTLRITGTVDDPKEDLSERLITAAGVRMFEQLPETGEKVIKFTRSVIGKDPDKVIEKGTKIIEEGSNVLREVGGVLDGILGRPKTEENR